MSDLDELAERLAKRRTTTLLEAVDWVRKLHAERDRYRAERDRWRELLLALVTTDHGSAAPRIVDPYDEDGFCLWCGVARAAAPYGHGLDTDCPWADARKAVGLP